jgi:arylsulfatase A-like enzyme/cytochrome c-type biogenesis protein CcmH/NrfG
MGMRNPTLRWSFPRADLRPVIGVALLALLAASPACRRGAEQETAQTKARDANVLFITLDTTRADHLSCYAADSRPAVTDRHSPARTTALRGDSALTDRRYSGAKTPHLDALAARGVRFAQAVAQVPLTLPSHACIFTGTYPEVHGLRDMGGFVLDPRHLTLASMSKQAGFLTAAFLGSKAVGRHFGLHQGFDTYDDQMPSRNQEGQLPGVFPERRAEVTTNRALDWLRQHAQENFFVWVHYYDPHDPYDPPEPYKSAYAKDPYSGEIAYTDAQAGRLLDFLDQQHLREKTLVVVIGDHGEGLNDHSEMTHGIFLYEDTLHVPFIIAGPEVPQGKVITPQVRSIDLLPTVAEFLRLPANVAAQGVSLWPLIERGQPLPGKGSNYSYVETLYPKTYMNWSELRGMRTDRWKFILAPRPELYDLERDPGEKENVIARHPAEADQLQKKIWEVIGPAARDQKVAYVPMNRETRQELESLGYISAGTPREIVLNMSGADPKDRVATLAAMRQSGHFLKMKAYAQAVRAMEAAVRSDAANPTARIYLASAYEKQRDWKRAIATYLGAVERGVPTDLILTRLGKAYLRTGELQKGVEALEKASRINPTDLDNLRNLGTAYLQLRRVNDAEKAFKAITIQDDSYAAALNGLGLVAVQRGDAETARRNFEKALAANPDDLEPVLNLGVLYKETGNKEQALHYLQMFLSKAPPDQYGEQIPLVREAIQELRQGT